MNPTETDSRNDFFKRIIWIVSVLLVLAVAFLVLAPRPESMAGRVDVSHLPAFNALINAITTVILIAGYVSIRKRNVDLHKRLMLAAFACSLAFLVGYVLYHLFKIEPKHYVGGFRLAYFFILITHIILAAAIAPLALFTLYWGWTAQVERHKRLARVTFPIWLYVSVTGVVIFLMLSGA